MSPETVEGCLTAIVTPMDSEGHLDKEALRHLVEYQALGGVEGIVVVGTTGESVTLTHPERDIVVGRCREWAGGGLMVVAGTGSNSTAEALRYTREAWDAGITHALVVDPYYNAPSSTEMRREYYAPIANAVKDMGIVPYVIPGRTGTRLEPPDIVALRDQCPNVVGIKDATGSDGFGRKVRRLVGERFGILSGDDARIATLVEDPAIRSQGAISVMSNVLPMGVSSYVRTLRSGTTPTQEQARMFRALQQMFSMVTVETVEPVPGGELRVKARNPVPVKAVMNILGIPTGPCRPPLGRLTRTALTSVLDKLRDIHGQCPELFGEIESAFDVQVGERLDRATDWGVLAYGD